MDQTPSQPNTDPFPPAGGACSLLLRSIDWSRHALGDPRDWPIELRTALRIALTSRFPTMIHWGPALHTFYNDASVAQLGGKHAGGMGEPARVWWRDRWDRLEPIFARVLSGESFYVEDAHRISDPEGGTAQAYFTHSHSPLWNDAGDVCGVYVVATETTARVLAEEKRASDERRNRQVLDSAIDYAIIATNLAGLITSWNEGARRILGWSEEEMLGHTADRFFLPEDVTAGRPQIEMTAALECGRGNDERWHMRKSGERFWASGEMTVLRDDDDEPCGFVKVLRDRTEQHETQMRLEASDARFQMALGAAGFIGSWEWDVAADRVYADSHFAQYFSVPAEDAANGVPIAGFIAGIHHEDRDRVARRIDTAVASCGDFGAEYRLQGPDGGVVWVSAQGRCLCDDEGRPTHFPGVAVEITERRIIEDKLRASEMRTRQALEAADMGSWEIAPHLDEQQCDARARTLFAHGPDEVMSVASLRDRVHSEDSARFGLEIDLALADREQVLDSQYRVVGRVGGQTWVHVRGRLVSGEDEPARFVGTVRDITPQRIAEERSALLTHELNHRIKNILAVVQSIVSQTLRRSETPQQANQAIGERLGALARAHDLLTRTSWSAAPLQSVIEGAVKVYEKGSGRIAFSGPEVLLSAKAALAFAMAMHELMTNAMKYGALANETGQVDVRWTKLSVAGVRKLELVWTESGGPEVATPTRMGFGARLMKGLSRDLGGEAHDDYRPTGLIWTLIADLSTVEEELTISQG